MNIINELEKFMSAKLAQVTNTFHLFKLEAKLARLSIVPLIIYFTLLIPGISVVWLSLNAIFIYFLWPILQNFLYVILVILVMNAGVLVFFSYQITKYIRHMRFLKTRANLSTTHADKK